MKNFEFSDVRYRAAHDGAAPGKIGFWAFWNPMTGTVLGGSGVLAEAKRTAVRKLRAAGVEPCILYILP